jgi:hypothetical protein
LSKASAKIMSADEPLSTRSFPRVQLAMSLLSLERRCGENLATLRPLVRR